MQCRAYVVCVPLAGRTIVRLEPYATWIPTSLWPGKYLRTTAPSAECGTRIVCVCVHNSFTRCCTTDTVLTSTHPHLQFRSCERQRHDRRHEPPVLKKKDGPPLKMFLFVRMSYGDDRADVSRTENENHPHWIAIACAWESAGWWNSKTEMRAATTTMSCKPGETNRVRYRSVQDAQGEVTARMHRHLLIYAWMTFIRFNSRKFCSKLNGRGYFSAYDANIGGLGSIRGETHHHLNLNILRVGKTANRQRGTFENVSLPRDAVHISF